MEDGVRLVADVWHPTGTGPWPTLLQRLPYGRGVASAPVLPSPTQLARLGYTVVVQDVRGRGDSEGVFEPFRHEASDGAATVEWAAALPSSNGDVVTYGYSYQGLIQLLAAARQPSPLRGVAALMCGSEPYEGWTYRGGCLQWSFVADWAAQLLAQPPGAVPRTPDLEAIPLSTALGPAPPRWFLDWLEHPADDDYWAAFRPDLAQIRVPLFTVAGYFDQFAAATAALASQVEAAAVFGPWPHMPWGTRHGDVELGDEASPVNATDALLGFFDRILRSGSAGRHVRWFSLGGGGWRVSPRWPPLAVRARWTATSGGDANSRHGGGRLVLGSPDEVATVIDVLVSEPFVPHPGDLSPLASVAAAEDRRDVLCYTSDPLTDRADIAGTAVVTIDARSDTPTFDLYATLVMVEPSGESRHLATGAHRLVALSDTGGDSARETKPGGVEIAIGPLAWLAQPGFRVRLEVAASYFPAFDRNPQTAGRPPALTPRTEYQVATIEVFSILLELPVIIESGSGPPRPAPPPDW
jgi:putative CocE/NonD family hydrolase